MTPARADICIIGGGPSGLVSAIQASERGAQTAVLERMDRVGKKLLATGNGRCNFSNTRREAEHFHGRCPDFIKPVLDQFGFDETLAFFQSIGMDWKADEEGRIFPVTDQASTVLNLLRYETIRLKVKEICGTEIIRIQKSVDGFVLQSKDNRAFACKKVILSAGGKAAPNLGSNGSGYLLARSLGHSIVEPFPAIVQIKVSASFLKKLKGIKVPAKVALVSTSSSVDAKEGEVLFTDYGLSGLPILHLSRYVHPAIHDGQKPVLELDLFPGKTSTDLQEELEKKFRQLHYKKAGEACEGFLNKRMVSVLLPLAGVDGTISSEEIRPPDIKRFVQILKRWQIDISGTLSWNEAQVTAGGISTDEIRPETLESKIVPGLFFAGEILDIDGDCGGYNLQWAWSSGTVAGMHASRG